MFLKMIRLNWPPAPFRPDSEKRGEEAGRKKAACQKPLRETTETAAAGRYETKE